MTSHTMAASRTSIGNRLFVFSMTVIGMGLFALPLHAATLKFRGNVHSTATTRKRVASTPLSISNGSRSENSKANCKPSRTWLDN